MTSNIRIIGHGLGAEGFYLFGHLIGYREVGAGPVQAAVKIIDYDLGAFFYSSAKKMAWADNSRSMGRFPPQD